MKDIHMQSCLCVGPKNGEPLCPCRMKEVQEIEGRYVQIIDLGPVAPKDKPTGKCPKCRRGFVGALYCSACGYRLKTTFYGDS